MRSVLLVEWTTYKVLTCPVVQVVGIVDIDCADLQGFDSIDQEGLEQLAKMLSDRCDWKDLVSPPPSLRPISIT